MSTAEVCIAVVGPATAVALWLRQRTGVRRSVVGGLAAAALTFILVFVIVLYSGLAAWSALAPVLVVIAAEFPLAFAMRTSRLGVRPSS